MMMDLDRRRVIERQKTRCREKIKFHAQNVILQGFVSLFFVSAGFLFAEKKSVIVPLVMAPSAACSLSKLTVHETKRRHYKEILNGLDKN